MRPSVHKFPQGLCGILILIEELAQNVFSNVHAPRFCVGPRLHIAVRGTDLVVVGES